MIVLENNEKGYVEVTQGCIEIDVDGGAGVGVEKKLHMIGK